LAQHSLSIWWELTDGRTASLEDPDALPGQTPDIKLMKPLFILISGVMLAGMLTLAGKRSLAGDIYYYQDSDGVLHFTDMPDSPDYRPYFCFNTGPDVDRGEILGLIRRYCSHYDLDADLVQAVMEVESDFEPRAVSTKGAQGLMQIMPETQQDLGLQDPFDPEANIEAGVRYLKQMLNTFASVETALAAYNAGPGNVKRYQGLPPFPETQRYVKRVLSVYQGLKVSSGHDTDS